MTLNDTHHAALRIFAEIFSIIPKDAEKQITDRNYGRRRTHKLPAGPKNVSVPVTHWYPTRK